MTMTEPFRSEMVSPGVEVRTERDNWIGKYVTTIYGGHLDGEVFKDAESRIRGLEQHERACRLARLRERWREGRFKKRHYRRCA